MKQNTATCDGLQKPILKEKTNDFIVDHSAMLVFPNMSGKHEQVPQGWDGLFWKGNIVSCVKTFGSGAHNLFTKMGVKSTEQQKLWMLLLTWIMRFTLLVDTHQNSTGWSACRSTAPMSLLKRKSGDSSSKSPDFQSLWHCNSEMTSKAGDTNKEQPMKKTNFSCETKLHFEFGKLCQKGQPVFILTQSSVQSKPNRKHKASNAAKQMSLLVAEQSSNHGFWLSCTKFALNALAFAPKLKSNGKQKSFFASLKNQFVATLFFFKLEHVTSICLMSKNEIMPHPVFVQCLFLGRQKLMFHIWHTLFTENWQTKCTRMSRWLQWTMCSTVATGFQKNLAMCTVCPCVLLSTRWSSIKTPCMRMLHLRKIAFKACWAWMLIGTKNQKIKMQHSIFAINFKECSKRKCWNSAGSRK